MEMFNLPASRARYHSRSGVPSDILALRCCPLYGTNRLHPLRKLSKEQVAKMREHSTRLSDFHIGLEFWMSGSRWRCTDVGTRVVIAIKLDHDDDPSWYNGPPYAVCECSIDEYVIHVCSLTRYGGNSGSFTDECRVSSRPSPMRPAGQR
jgi:hypothetical protein